jgi:hypothetical protein
MAVQLYIHRIECLWDMTQTVVLALQDEQYTFEQNMIDTKQVMLVQGMHEE